MRITWLLIYLTIIPPACVGYKMVDHAARSTVVAIIISHPTCSSGTIVLFKTLQIEKTEINETKKNCQEITRTLIIFIEPNIKVARSDF